MPAEYAHPEVLVSTAWVDEHRHDPGLRIVESDEDVLLYEQGHIEGAVKIDWHTDLQDRVVRDVSSGTCSTASAHQGRRSHTARRSSGTGQVTSIDVPSGRVSARDRQWSPRRRRP